MYKSPLSFYFLAGVLNPRGKYKCGTVCTGFIVLIGTVRKDIDAAKFLVQKKEFALLLS